jgi:RNA polymerase-binding protein DksA
MDLDTQTHLKSLRGALEYRVGTLQAELHAAEQQRIHDASAASPEVSDRKDIAAHNEAAEVAEGSEARDREEAARVTEALQRLDAGTYGNCLGCGEPIGWHRLLVQPAAARCVACQAIAEHQRPRG